jgi:uncharacterized membrane protein
MWRRWNAKKTFKVTGSIQHRMVTIARYTVKVAAKNREEAESLAIRMMEDEIVFMPFETVKDDTIHIPK